MRLIAYHIATHITHVPITPITGITRLCDSGRGKLLKTTSLSPAIRLVRRA